MYTEQNLLDEYKKYDYLNEDGKRPLVKILVSYIKPSFLFKSKILTPIQLGKAVEKADSKDGVQSDENLKWLHENCEFNDDFEGGISEHNRRIGFLTGTYWAWKNYEKLGDPEYFGSFGYRRLFDSEVLKNIGQFDMIVPQKRHNDQTYRKRLINYLGCTFFQETLGAIYKKLNVEKKHVEEYLNQNDIYFDEIYIMRKNIFFEFCEWIFPLLSTLINIEKSDDNSEKIMVKDLLKLRNEKRDIAYLTEFLTGYFIYKKLGEHKLNIVNVETIVLSKDNPCNPIDVLRERIKLKTGLG